jgi:solute carrier family 30 (zinc transporter), member 2
MSQSINARTGLLSQYKDNVETVERKEYHKARRQLLCASFFCFLFMLIEAAGGIYVGSLAIMSDAAHLLADCAGFAMALTGLYVAQKPTNLRYTYGYQRAEIIGAILSVLLLWLLTGIIIYQAVLRVLHPEDVNGFYMFIIASFGLVVNVVMGVILIQSGHGHSHGGLPGSSDNDCSHGHSHGDGNDHGDKNHVDNIAVRSAFVHVLGDGLQSFGVMIAAGLIWYNPKWKIADPICSFLFGIIVLATTPGILKQGFAILLNAAPTNMSRQVYSRLYAVDCIENVHDLHLWPLNASGKLALTVHIIATDKVKALDNAQKIAIEFGIRHTTIQVECAGCVKPGCNEIENCNRTNTHKCIMEEEDDIKLMSTTVSDAEDEEENHHGHGHAHNDHGHSHNHGHSHA